MAVCNQEMEDFITPFYPLICGEGKYQSALPMCISFPVHVAGCPSVSSSEVNLIVCC